MRWKEKEEAIKTAPGAKPETVQPIRIRDVLRIAETWISAIFLEEAGKTPGIGILKGPYERPFDAEGRLFRDVSEKRRNIWNSNIGSNMTPWERCG